ncbi:MAG: nitroreductase family protein [Candidatus Omnitrophica bacterium]|nr:nitroreductase family protein [Candidatus Omnitrophota bacterium]MDD5574120.1 nitroreductase family protein [Candidatus Omnitrophota bacterium]
MKDILTAITQRRSVRSFGRKKIAPQDIKKILEAGRWAPSGLNNQPWRFLVIDDDKRRDGVAAFTKYGSVIRRAAAVLIVCMDTADSYNREKDLMALGAAIQNMLLEAQDLGIGSCWLGEILNKKKEVAAFLKLNADLDFLAAVALGYPEGKTAKGCRKPLQQLMIVHEKKDSRC